MIRGVDDLTSFKWATVTGNAPLAIRLDGDSSPLALIPDSLVDPTTLFPGDRVRVELSVRKVVIHGVSNGTATSGEMRMTASASAPRGWMVCQGQSLSRSQYPQLFASIGTQYGAADSTHFSIPDMRGRVAVGLDSGQTEFTPRGQRGGEKTHSLTPTEMPPHTHGKALEVRASNDDGGTAISTAKGGDYGLYYGPRIQAGSSIAHNNLQPYMIVNYIIKL